MPTTRTLLSLQGAAKWLCAAVVMTGVLVVAFESRRSPSVEGLVREFMREEAIPGGVIAYGRVHEQPTVRAFGLADVEAAVDVSSNHRFPLGSLSKPITAAAVMFLADRGRLQLEDRLGSYFPEIASAADPRYRQITIQTLLQHSGGWDRTEAFDPIDRLGEVAEGLARHQVVRCDPLARMMLREPLQFTPGERFAYSNVGYCWLGMVIEQVTGIGYERFVRDSVLAPHAIYGLQIGKMGISPETRVSQYYAGGGLLHEKQRYAPPSFLLPGLGAIGGWTGTAEEYFQFVSDAVGVRQATSTDKLRNPEEYYGLGWFIRPATGDTTFAHAGILPGSFGVAVRTSDGFAAVALFNSRPVEAQRAARRLWDSLPSALRQVRSGVRQRKGRRAHPSAAI